MNISMLKTVGAVHTHTHTHILVILIDKNRGSKDYFICDGNRLLFNISCGEY